MRRAEFKCATPTVARLWCFFGFSNRGSFQSHQPEHGHMSVISRLPSGTSIIAFSIGDTGKMLL